LTSQQLHCGQCQFNPPRYKLITSAGYETPLKQLIASLKYRNNQLVAHELAQHLAKRVTQLIDNGLLDTPACLIPVPLHRKRLQQRGYNQAYLIAQALSAHLNIPILDCVQRVINTTTQTELDASERQSNMHGAFVLSKAISPGTVALVDDVYTTGTTMKELARTINTDEHLDIQLWSIVRTTIE